VSDQEPEEERERSGDDDSEEIELGESLEEEGESPAGTTPVADV
jgi:hypothetical protein